MIVKGVAVDPAVLNNIADADFDQRLLVQKLNKGAFDFPLGKIRHWRPSEILKY